MYSKLTYSLDRKVAGNGSAGLGHGYLDKNFYTKNPWYEDIFSKYVNGSKDWWKVWSHMPEFGKDLIEVKMNKKAQHSDFIDFAGFLRGFIVNDHLRSILEKAHLPKHNFYAVTFDQNGIVVNNYWWFVYDMETGEETVDFSQCEYDFSYQRANYGNDFSANINSYQDYLNVLYQTGKAVSTSKLVLNTNFDRDLDIWGAQFLTAEKGYISKKLLAQFDSAKISGFRTMEPSGRLIFTS